MNFKDTDLPATREEIAKLEKEFQIIFPDGYCEFLLGCNGGVPVRDYMLTPFGELGVRRLKGTRRKDDELFSDLRSANLASYAIPSEFFIIGDDVCGNQILLQKDLPNGIYWWNHESEEIYKIADDFVGFLSALTDDPYE